MRKEIFSLGILNDRQLQGLADLSFDIAKAAFIGSLLVPTLSVSGIGIVLNILKGLLVGSFSVYIGLLLLKKQNYERQ